MASHATRQGRQRPSSRPSGWRSSTDPGKPDADEDRLVSNSLVVTTGGRPYGGPARKFQQRRDCPWLPDAVNPWEVDTGELTQGTCEVILAAATSLLSPGSRPTWGFASSHRRLRSSRAPRRSRRPTWPRAERLGAPPVTTSTRTPAPETSEFCVSLATGRPHPHRRGRDAADGLTFERSRY
jgi:hypothetical protein